MEVYHVYLRTFIASRTCGDVATEGDATPALAAKALAVHDAMHGREPKTIDALLSAVNGMCPEVVVVAGDEKDCARPLPPHCRLEIVGSQYRWVRACGSIGGLWDAPGMAVRQAWAYHNKEGYQDMEDEQ